MTDEEASALKGLMDTLPEGIISMDLKGNITQLNKGLVELLGHKPFNLKGKPIFEFAPAYEKKAIETLIQEVSVKKRVRDREIQLYDVMGQLRNLTISISLLENTDKKPIGLLSILKDVKEIAKLELELESLKDFFQNILNNAGVGIIATDMKGDILFGSKGVGDILRKPPKELVGENIIKISPNPLELNEKFTTLLKTGEPFVYEPIIKKKKEVGNYINIFTLLKDKDQKPTGAIVVFEDVTKVKDIEERLKNINSILQRHSRDLESIIEVSQKLGSSLDIEEVYKIMAQATRKIVGVDVTCFFRNSRELKRLVLESLEGISIESMEESDLKMSENGFYSSISKLSSPKIIPDLLSEDKIEPQLIFIENDLKSAVMVPLFTENRLFGVLAVFFKESKEFKRDEVEILQSIGSSGAIAAQNALLYREVKNFASDLEIKVKERTIELEQSNRLKDLFIDIMGHDLLKPADIARLSTEVVLDMEEDPSKKKILKNILESNVKIIELIENASILAKLEAGEELELRAEDLKSILKKVVEEYEDSAKKRGIKIKMDADGDFLAMVNPLIYDVFSNLIGNAIKYGPSDSTVNVSMGEKDGKWRITVADKGGGIPEKQKEAVFDRFKRLEKGSVKGSGLGLAIVKRVVKAHDGRVWVEDNPGGGSLFAFELPKS
jgi:PAS domain S-box-containing protein